MSSVDLPDWLPATVPGGANAGTFNLGATATGATAATPITPVAAFAQLAILVTGNIPGTEDLQLSWYQDAAGVTPLTFNPQFLKSGSAQHQIVVPVGGPYLKVSIHNRSGGPISYFVFMQGYTFGGRLSVPTITGLYVPLDVQAAALGANATVDSSPFVGVPGKGVLWVSAGQNYTGSLQRWNGAAWDVIDHFAGAANADTILSVNLPGDDWRVEVVNTTAIATTFSAAVVLEP